LRGRGAALLEKGQAEDALKELREALRLDPNDFVAWRDTLIALEKLGREAELERAVEVIASTFGAGLIVSHFAIVLREAGRRALAERLFVAAAELSPGRSDVWSSLGNLAYDRRDYARARSCYEKALKLHPGSVEALDNLGKIFTVAKDYDRALDYLREALKLSPGNASILSTVGGIELKLGLLEEARTHLESGLENARSEATRLNLHGNLGGLYIKLEDWDQAEESFRKVLELSPGDAQALRALEYIGKRRG
jgi:tetratricopeptide (TPR) repeat protein